MSIFYYKGEDGAFHPIPALVGPPGKDGVIAQIENENGEKFTSLPTLKFLNCEVTADTEKVTVSPHGGQGRSGGGHTIQDSENSNLPQRGILKFAEGFQVSDDVANGKTVISCAAGTKNVAGHIGEIVFFADEGDKENFVKADGASINPDLWPELAAFAVTAQWEVDEETGWRKTPNLQGRFLLSTSTDHAVNTTGGEEKHTLTVQEMPAHAHTYQNPLLAFTSDPPSGQSTVHLAGTSSGAGWMGTDAIGKPATASTGGGQPHNNMPPYYVVSAWIRAKVDEITATAVEINGNTLGGFEDGQVLTQQNGKMTGASITPDSIGAATASQGTLASTAVQPYKAGDTINITRCCASGFVSGGGASLAFTIPLDRPVIAARATFSGNISIRGSSGQYAVQNYQFSVPQSSYITSAGITFTGDPTWTNQPTNNIALSVDIRNGTITLS